MGSSRELDHGCRRCGKSLHGVVGKRDEEKIFCSSCMIELAEQHIPERTRGSQGPSRKKQAKIVAKWILLVCCSVLIIVNSLVLVRLLAREKRKKFVRPSNLVFLCPCAPPSLQP